MYIVIIILLITLVLCAYQFYEGFTANIMYVKSELNGKSYLVRNLPDKQMASNMLSQLSMQMEKFSIHYANEHKSSKTKRLVSRFKPDNVSESTDTSKFTSYNINKGQKIVFCIRQKDTNEIIDFNTLFFVALHELTHIITKSVGHQADFWNNFKDVLQFAIKHKYYTYVPYHDTPKKYCGIMITDTPYKL